jgi:hypothetical protein
MSGKIATRNMTELQEKFIDVYEETNSIQTALKESGMTKANFNRDMVKDTPFGIAFRMAMDNTLKKYKYSKLSNMDALVRIRDESMDDPERHQMAISAINLMTKMMDGHLAVQKRIEEHTNIDVKAVIDFTKPKEHEQTDDIGYIEIGNGE